MSSPAANAKTAGSYSGVATDAETAPTVTAENAIKPVNKTEISFFIIFLPYYEKSLLLTLINRFFIPAVFKLSYSIY